MSFVPINASVAGSVASQPQMTELDEAVAFLHAMANNNAVFLDLPTVVRTKKALALARRNGVRVPSHLCSQDVKDVLEEDTTLNQPIVYRIEGKTMNLSATSNRNFLPSAMGMAASDRVVHYGSDACTKCQKGGGVYAECVTLSQREVVEPRDFLHNACMNCGHSNQFAGCTFSDHVAIPRRTRNVQVVEEVAQSRETGRPLRTVVASGSGGGGRSSSASKVPLTRLAALYHERAERGGGFGSDSELSETEDEGDDAGTTTRDDWLDGMRPQE